MQQLIKYAPAVLICDFLAVARTKRHKIGSWLASWRTRTGLIARIRTIRVAQKWENVLFIRKNPEQRG